MEITPEQLRATRKGIGLTARDAAASIHVALRTWQCYEAPADLTSFRAMPAGLLELFCVKHNLPFPPLRLDGTPTISDARVISILSGTGGSGKTPITLELARALARAGRRSAVVTDSSFSTRDRFTFENPLCVGESDVTFTAQEAKNLRKLLREAGVIDVAGTTQMAGIDLFIYQGELNRLAKKEAPLMTLDQLKTKADFIFLDISHQADTALLVSDIVVFVIDLENQFACESAINAFGSSVARHMKSGGSPQLFCLLTNKMPSHFQTQIGNYYKVKNFGPLVLSTTFSKDHVRERRKLHRGKSWKELRKHPLELLVDAAPNSMASIEYHSLANELLNILGIRFRI